MRDFQERRKFRKIIYSKFSVVILIVLAILSIRAVWGVYEKYRISDQALLNSQSELSELLNRADRVSRGVARLGTSRGVEEEVRLKFPVAKSGETVIVLIDGQMSSTSSTTSSGLWRWLKNIFY